MMTIELKIVSERKMKGPFENPKMYYLVLLHRFRLLVIILNTWRATFHTGVSPKNNGLRSFWNRQKKQRVLDVLEGSVPNKILTVSS